MALGVFSGCKHNMFGERCVYFLTSVTYVLNVSLPTVGLRYAILTSLTISNSALDSTGYKDGEALPPSSQFRGGGPLMALASNALDI